MEAPKCQSLEITHLGCLVCFLREGLCNAHRDLPSSGSPVLGVKVCTTMSGVILAFLEKGLSVFWNSFSKLGWLASKPSDLSACSCFPNVSTPPLALVPNVGFGHKLSLHDGKASKHFIDIGVSSVFLKMF